MEDIKNVAMDYYEIMTGGIYAGWEMAWVENIFVKGTPFYDAYEDLMISIQIGFHCCYFFFRA